MLHRVLSVGATARAPTPRQHALLGLLGLRGVVQVDAVQTGLLLGAQLQLLRLQSLLQLLDLLLLLLQLLLQLLLLQLLLLT